MKPASKFALFVTKLIPKWGVHPMAKVPATSVFSIMKHNKYPQGAKPTRVAQPTSAEFQQNEINFAPSPDEVARRAYFSYENTGSQPGHEVQHWLQAESDLIAERNQTRVHGFHNKT